MTCGGLHRGAGHMHAAADLGEGDGQGVLEEAEVPPEEAEVHARKQRPQPLAAADPPGCDVGRCCAADGALSACMPAQQEPQLPAAVLRKGCAEQAQQATLRAGICLWESLDQELHREWRWVWRLC